MKVVMAQDSNPRPARFLRPRLVVFAMVTGVLLAGAVFATYRATLSLREFSPMVPRIPPPPEQIPFPSSPISRIAVQRRGPGGTFREVPAVRWPVIVRALQSARLDLPKPGEKRGDDSRSIFPPVMLLVEFSDGTKFNAQTEYDLSLIEQPEMSGVSIYGSYRTPPDLARPCGSIVTDALK